MQQQPIKKAVLLAAGRGTRLQPFTDKTPKPLLVHRGKPTLDYILDSLLLAGVDEIVLVVHHLGEQIEQYAAIRSAGYAQSVEVVYQAHLAGTAHALEAVLENRPEFIDQAFLLSATDYLVPRGFFSDLLGFHNQHAGELSVSLKALAEHELSSRSSVRFRPDNSIEEIVEKPAPGTAPSDIGANLTFVLPAAIVSYLDEVPLSSRGEREIQQAINGWLRQGGLAHGIVQATPAEWQPPDK